MIKKFIKKLLVSLRKKETAYIPKNTSYGDISTDILSAFMITDGIANEDIYSNFILYKEININNSDSMKEIDDLKTLLDLSSLRYITAKSRYEDTESIVLIISGSIANYDALEKLYQNDYKYAYNKHLKNLLHYLHEYSILGEEESAFLRISTSLIPIDIVVRDGRDICISRTDNDNWKRIYATYDIGIEILHILTVYYNGCAIGFDETSEEYSVYNIESLAQFLYNQTFVFDESVRDRIHELSHMLSQEFKIDVLDKNIYELNLFSNPLDQSSLYDEVDEIID